MLIGILRAHLDFGIVVYDPKKNDNEEKSAELFETFSQEVSPVHI